MSVDCAYPNQFDILRIYDKNDVVLIDNLPLCEVIKGDIINVENDLIKMQSFENNEISTYSKYDILLCIQDAFDKLNIEYVEIITKDLTKIKI